MATSLTNAWRPGDGFVLEALHEAQIDDPRLIYDASNYVFLVRLQHPAHGEGLGVYKPVRGERPLHDFPGGTLHAREVAAYELSQLLGWQVIPPTVQRDGPQGVGSLQLFIEHDPNEHYFTLRDDDRFEEQLVRFAAFDLIANNADRKGGHLLRDEHDRLWGIDNGLCFHAQDKLRTVIWDYAGAALSPALVDDIDRVAGCVEGAEGSAAALVACLSEAELRQLVRRCRELTAKPVLPEMYPWRCTPWPLI